MWERPVHEQVSVLRHDMAGLDSRQTLSAGLMERLTVRLEHMEERQTVMQEQLARIPIVTPESIEAAVGRVIDDRTVMTKANRYDQIAASARTITLRIVLAAAGLLTSAAIGWLLAGGG